MIGAIRLPSAARRARQRIDGLDQMVGPRRPRGRRCTTSKVVAGAALRHEPVDVVALAAHRRDPPAGDIVARQPEAHRARLVAEPVEIAHAGSGRADRPDGPRPCCRWPCEAFDHIARREVEQGGAIGEPARRAALGRGSGRSAFADRLLEAARRPSSSRRTGVDSTQPSATTDVDHRRARRSISAPIAGRCAAGRRRLARHRGPCCSTRR